MAFFVGSTRRPFDATSTSLQLHGYIGNPGVMVLGPTMTLLPVHRHDVRKQPLSAGNFKLDNNRNGTMRSAIFLLTFTIVHALGNFVDMLGGPDELNGEGYLFDRIHWTGALGMAKDA